MCGFADAKLCAHCTSDHGRGSRNSNNNLSPGEILTEVRPIPQIPLSYKNKHERDFYHVVCFLRSFVQNESGGEEREKVVAEEVRTGFVAESPN